MRKITAKQELNMLCLRGANSSWSIFYANDEIFDGVLLDLLIFSILVPVGTLRAEIETF